MITFAYDDIANNPKNPFKGKVFHDYNHVDVYNGVIIDYRGNDVTRDNFVRVLKGDKKLENNKKKVLKRNPFKGKVFHDYNHVDVYNGVIIDYRGNDVTRDNFVRVLKGDKKLENNKKKLYGMELNDTLAYMHSNKKFNKLVLYVDACYSGSMFRDILPSNMGIYATTSAKEDEGSHAIFCMDEEIDVCLANEYSFHWIVDSEFKDLKTHTLEEQYVGVKRTTMFSHVMKYGEMTMGSLPVGKFQGHYDLLIHRNDGAIAPNAVDRKPSCQAHLLSRYRRLMQAATEEEHETAWRKLHRALQLGHIVKNTFRDFVEDVTTHHKPSLKGLSKRDELMCFKAVHEVALHSPQLMELCKAGYEAETLIDYVRNICS
ncbi:hypothetical protein T265_11509 [Opisthorchis viverrini]|uniref:Peptidase C13 family protein n=1 Tax=Opisthorchis viverrini TaxID=6198 RepID=A0A074ZX91_OPIVI|nr:hypothetical protein T265_11509 [Opisthorchis viverrini]KER19804.1 hypothetical protein T265_11509 [Opisthorchis viverrini]